MSNAKCSLSLLVITLAAYLGGSGNVLGKTPDLETPSMETICDIYGGAAFGVCNAYCEAMDCHLDEPRASERACTRKRDRFVSLTGEIPPCELSCPCAAIDQFNDFVTGDSQANSCESPSVGQIRLESQISPVEFSGIFVSSGPFGNLCGYYDSEGWLDSIFIEDSESEQCIDLMEEIVVRDELICEGGGPPPPA